MSKHSLRRCSQGFIEHGHLYGTSAFIIHFDYTEIEDAITLSDEEIFQRIADSHCGRVHFVLVDGRQQSIALAWEATRRFQSKRISVVTGPNYPLSHAFPEVIVHVDENEMISSRAAKRHGLIESVSFDHWPGESGLHLIEQLFPQSRFYLLLDKEHLGDAKVCLAERSDDLWKVIPTQPLNDELEQAEIESRL